MINGSEISDQNTQITNLKRLFNPKKQSPISLVRIACHSHEFKNCLKAAKWLKKKGKCTEKRSRHELELQLEPKKLG